MIRIKLMDGSSQEIRREEALGVYSLEGLFHHASLTTDGLICLGGKLIPVKGPLPEGGLDAPAEERPWLMLFHSHGQVIRGLPEFDDEISLNRRAPVLVEEEEPAADSNGLESQMDDEEEARLLQEMEDLLKSA